MARKRPHDEAEEETPSQQFGVGEILAHIREGKEPNPKRTGGAAIEDAPIDATDKAASPERTKVQRKVSHGEAEEETSNQLGGGETLAHIRDGKEPNPKRIKETAIEDAPIDATDKAASASPQWTKVERKSSKPSKQSKKNSQASKTKAGNYPAIKFSHNNRLQSAVKIGDLQNLVLYALADAASPQWCAVSHRGHIRKAVVVMAPGLEAGMFDGNIALEPEDKTTDEAAGIETAPHPLDPPRTSKDAAPSGTDKPNRIKISPDDYYPVKLDAEKLPAVLKPLADMFEHVWPVMAPGDDKFFRVFSPLQAMLTAPLPKSKEDKKHKGAGPPSAGKYWQNQPTSIVELIASVDQLQENEYTLHPALFRAGAAREAALQDRKLANTGADDGWVDSAVEELADGTVPPAQMPRGSTLGGRTVVALDCEMCKTGDETSALTRISLLGWDGSVIMDELVKPDKAIVDYVTAYSGITKEMLEPVTTTLKDIQTRLLKMLTPRTIIVGHSLNADLDALKMTHPFIVDTSMLYPHPRGPPLKSSLKWLSQKYLAREIQKQHGTTGHDSVEDARACLDLTKQKCEKGVGWGSSEARTESIFTRLGRAAKPKEQQVGAGREFRKGAVVDWGEPSRGYGACAELSVGCSTDEDVVRGVGSVVAASRSDGKEGRDDGVKMPACGIDFVWARLRELEAIRGWWSSSKTSDLDAARAVAVAKGSGEGEGEGEGEVGTATLRDAVARTVKNIADIYDALPPCTAFIVYTGTGDPRESARYQALHQQFKREFQTKKWDELSVQWTDREEQAQRQAVRRACEGLGFIAVK